MIYGDIVCLVIAVLLAAILYGLAGYAMKVKSSKWRLCYTFPVIWVLVCIGFVGFEVCMIGVYIGAAMLLVGFFYEKVVIRKLVSIAAIISAFISLMLCLNISSYRMPDFAEDFRRGFEEMKTHYVLTEHKKIDWDALYEEYSPRFEEADANCDKVAATVAWLEFAMEFHDGHVSFIASDDEVTTQALNVMYGNDYGLSLMQLEDGTVVAVQVECGSLAEQAGIGNGTVVTAWDGMEIEDAIGKAQKEMPPLFGFASIENEEFYSALLVAGMGGKSVKVTYLDEQGVEQETTLIAQGTYADRWQDAVECIDKGVEISNLEWQHVNDNTALMRMRFMIYDAQANHSEMEAQIREQLISLKAEGVENIVFDLRSNGGGSGLYVKHILKLIAPEGEHIYAFDGAFDTETVTYLKDEEATKAAGGVRYQAGGCSTYQGEDLWAHGKIIILVNAQTGSAGDHFTMLASAYPNVTVMGFTHTSCAAQGVNSVQFDYGQLSYSGALLVNEDGSVFIDTDEMRRATVPLDVKIPFDETAVQAIFQDGEDYVLDYAVNYLNQ